MAPGTRAELTASGRTSVRGWSCLATLVAGYLLFATMAGAPNSPLTTPLPAGARAPGWTARLATALRMGRVGRPGIIAAALFVMVLLLGAFVLLLVEARAGRVRLSLVLVGSGISLAIATTGPLLLSRDVFSYAAYGRIAQAYGRNPYLVVPASFPRDPFVSVMARQWLHARSPYGPVFTLLGEVLTRVSRGSPNAMILGYKAVAGVAVAAATLLTAWAARMTRPGRAALAAAIVGLNPVVVIHTVGGGHADALIALALAGALALAVWAAPASARGTDQTAAIRPTTERVGAASDAGRWTIKAASIGVTAVLALACLIKIVIGPALALWLWWTVKAAPGRARARTALLHLGSVALLSLVLSAPFLSSWQAVRTLPTQAGSEVWASASSLVARIAQAVVDPLAGSSAVDVAARAIEAGCLVIVVVLVWLLGSRGISWYAPSPPALRSPADGWGGAMLLLALAAPFLLPWYTMWFVVFIGLMDDEVQMWIGVATAGLLALTLIPADPPVGITTWGVMLGVHYAVAPMMLGLLITMIVRLARVPDRTTTST